jgi:hypothetical protein
MARHAGMLILAIGAHSFTAFWAELCMLGAAG